MFLAERLTNYAVQLQFAALDSRTVHEVCRRLIDSLGCACAAYRAEAAQVGRRVAEKTHGIPGASYLGGAQQS